MQCIYLQLNPEKIPGCLQIKRLNSLKCFITQQTVASL